MFMFCFVESENVKIGGLLIIWGLSIFRYGGCAFEFDQKWVEC
jgi:hypothetical protein